MKKFRLILIGILIVIMGLFITSCGDNEIAEDKKVITPEEFINICENCGYLVGKTSDEDQKVYRNLKTDDIFIQFAILDSENDTVLKTLYNRLNKKLTKGMNEYSILASVNYKNYQNFMTENDENFLYTSRVENTVFTITGSLNKKEEIMEIIEELNY